VVPETPLDKPLPEWQKRLDWFVGKNWEEENRREE